MISSLQARRNLLFQSIVTFVVLSGLQLSTWLPLRYWKAWGGGNFLDTWQILRYGKCYETVGLSVYENIGTNCSNYLYGRTLLQLISFLGVDTTQTQILGYIFLVLLAVGLTVIFPIQNRRDFLLFLAVLLSPPIMLLADRGNFDILIFLVLILVAKSVSRSNFYLAFFLLSLTVLMKYYTAPVFLVVIFFTKIPKERILGAAFFLASIGFAIRDILITQTQYPHGSEAQFGFFVWGEYLNNFSSTQANQVQKYALSAIVFSIVFFIVLLSTQKLQLNRVNFIEITTWRFYAFWIFLTVSISCYFGGMNFDYRLIYLATTLLLASRVLIDFNTRALIESLVIFLWLSFPSGGLQPLGDLFIEIIVAYCFVCLMLEVKRKLKITFTSKIGEAQ